MRLNYTNDGPVPIARSASERWGATLPLSLFALGAGYVLLVAAPLLGSRLSALSQLRGDFGRSLLPTPLAVGLALLGAAALVLVLAQLVRDVETRPYVSIAPVLAVFSGFVLTSLRVKLPIEGLAAEHGGVLVLALALLGGSLICREGVAARALGWGLVFSPGALLAFVAVAGPNGEGDLVAALRRLDGRAGMYLGLLSLSSLALGIVGAVARTLASRSGRDEPAPAIRMPRPTTSPGWDAPATHMTPQGLTYQAAQSYGYAGASASPYYSQEIAAPQSRGSLTRVLTIAAALVLAALAGAYWFGMRPAAQRDGTDASARPADAPALRASAGEQAAPSAISAPEAAAALAPSVAPTVSPLVPAREGHGSSARRHHHRRSHRGDDAASSRAAEAEPKARRGAEPESSVKVPAVDAQAEKNGASEGSSTTTRATAAKNKSEEPQKAAEPGPAPKLAQPAAQSGQGKGQEVDVEALVDGALKNRKQAAQPAKNEQDLDFDQLMNKALKKGGEGVKAADDPLLGISDESAQRRKSGSSQRR